ncbi:ribosome silencing factor [Enteractinococcus fodinae]|uniref:Ribosomal silencing factor RsfS n=1 Tax=Enteractinococcus fodinae TaxID=684663 RepID=A0ABU2B094_9MICC|nr:ribosome silencing factor [Enteractinococcus fodinae]MDR7347023.1 ribosome-associated protein [Enteractinococcus fodinae]
MAVPEPTLKALHIASNAAAERQAENISAVDVADRLGITDAFFFASAQTERQVKSIIEEIEDALREQLELKPLRREGQTEGRWVLLDYGHFVIHIQHNEERENYALDRLWSDAPQIDLPQADEPQS